MENNVNVNECEKFNLVFNKRITKVLKIFYYILFAMMSVLTILFFFDIKFVMLGLNIIAWDMVAIAIYFLVKMGQLASRINAVLGGIVVIALMLLEITVGIFLLAFLHPSYTEKTEPQTHRTFVTEAHISMLNKGTVKLYERFGPFLLACNVDEYVGDITHLEEEYRSVHVSDDGKFIVVHYFFLKPEFYVPLE